MRLPYDRHGTCCFMPEIARHAAPEGFAVVMQDVSGNFRCGHLKAVGLGRHVSHK